MRRIIRSFGFAWEGLLHALFHGRNLRLFVLGECIVLLLATQFSLQDWEWLALLFSAAFFIAIELLNTALECLTDAVDALPKEPNRALHRSMKAAKDVSAAAALIGFVTALCTIVAILGPDVWKLLR